MAHDHAESHEVTMVDNWDDMPDHRKTYKTFFRLITWGSFIAFVIAFGAFVYWY